MVVSVDTGAGGRAGRRTGEQKGRVSEGGATDVIRYHAFVRVRFRADRDIKLREGER